MLRYGLSCMSVAHIALTACGTGQCPVGISVCGIGQNCSFEREETLARSKDANSPHPCTYRTATTQLLVTPYEAEPGNLSIISTIHTQGFAMRFPLMHWIPSPTALHLMQS
jgi:hypothetical protein